MLLIIDNNIEVCKFFSCKSKFLDASNLTLLETIKKVKEQSEITKIFFPIELKFKDSTRPELKGLELFKHIRLSNDLGNLQFAPILLGYTIFLESILRNPESTILCSPSTRLFCLQEIDKINESPFFSSDEVLTKDILKPYVLFTDSDEAKSEHDRRNEQGPIKLEKELNDKATTGLNDLELWQKKIRFLQTETIHQSAKVKFSEEEYKQTVKGKKILYLDDEADKWIGGLQKVFEGATIDAKNDYKTIDDFVEGLQIQQDAIRNNYTELDRQLQEIYLNKSGKNNPGFILKYNDVIKVKNELATILNYDIVLLDMRLDRVSDKTKPISQYSGVQILKKLQDLNPFIPVVMFTASNKIESYRSVMLEGAYDFWIKNVSSATDLKHKVATQLKNIFQNKRISDLKEVYAKYLMIKSRDEIYCYESDEINLLVETKKLSKVHKERIYNSCWFFIGFIQRYVSGSVGSYEIDELWKMTGDSIQIRVPAIYGKSKDKIEEFSNSNKLEKLKRELEYRWIRNAFLHNKVDQERFRWEGNKKVFLTPTDPNLSLEYITHTIDFLLDYR